MTEKRRNLWFVAVNPIMSEWLAFVDLQTGEFAEVMLIRDDKDLDGFLMKYDISIAEIAKE